jgi:predicted ATPase/DNA-binding winged helix-turn-helix (wHTH) protein
MDAQPAMDRAPAPEYRFEHYRLVPSERRLLAGERPVKLGGRAFDMLVVLVEARDRAVSKAELMDRVWPKLVVEENNLQVQVAALRKVLGPAAISTIPGRGYRFTVPVEAPSPAEAPMTAGTEPAPAPPRSRPRMPLYGRDADVAAIGALLAQHAIVSIVGAGGIGKTRVAHAVADALRDTFEDGVRIVEFAPVSDTRLVVPEVARALGIQQTATPADLVETIVAALAGRRLLVLLDNCEHVLDAVADFVDALSRAAGGVRVLVTSQEPLKTTLEHVFRMGPLAVPADAQRADWQDHGAVQLFTSRARAADPRFTGGGHAESIVEICRRLDGIPLALELAAARVPLLGVDGLRAHLDERFHVLTGGSRFVLRRHQTLRAAFDFSHGLLADAERTVFRRLGVFAGSFAIDAAQDTCADAALDRWQVLECLAALVDKSMVVAEGDASPRLRLLETTRAYALEKLADAGETLALLERHARNVAAQFRSAYDVFWRLSPEQWLQRFAPDLDNLRVAIDWALREDPALAIELVGDSLKLWQELGLQPEELRHCAGALAHVDSATPARAAGRLWYAQAMMYANSWTVRSRDSSRRAVQLLRDADDPAVFALALTRLACWSRALVTQEQRDALAELEGLESPAWTGQLLCMLPRARASLYRNGRRFAEARAEFQRSHDISMRLGHARAATIDLMNVAETTLAAGDVDDSIAISHEAIEMFAGSPDTLFQMFCRMCLVAALVTKSDVAAAREAFEAAAQHMSRHDMLYRYGDTAALFAALENRLDAAARLLGYADTAYALRSEAQRDPTEVPAREAALARLSQLPAEQLRALMREGAAMSGAEALAEALARPQAP